MNRIIGAIVLGISFSAMHGSSMAGAFLAMGFYLLSEGREGGETSE